MKKAKENLHQKRLLQNKGNQKENNKKMKIRSEKNNKRKIMKLNLK